MPSGAFVRWKRSCLVYRLKGSKELRGTCEVWKALFSIGKRGVRGRSKATQNPRLDSRKRAADTCCSFGFRLEILGGWQHRRLIPKSSRLEHVPRWPSPRRFRSKRFPRGGPRLPERSPGITGSPPRIRFLPAGSPRAAARFLGCFQGSGFSRQIVSCPVRAVATRLAGGQAVLPR